MKKIRIVVTVPNRTQKPDGRMESGKEIIFDEKIVLVPKKMTCNINAAVKIVRENEEIIPSLTGTLSRIPTDVEAEVFSIEGKFVVPHTPPLRKKETKKEEFYSSCFDFVQDLLEDLGLK